MSEAGLFAAYAAIGSMAVVPIYFGSYSSLVRLPSAKPRAHDEFAEFSDSEDEEDESEAV
ncbi:hypothetical protein LPJ70_004918, partial [Coemansia sp. RSA 2708]